MLLADIKISESFKTSKPNEYKLDACRKYYEQNKKIDRDIVIDSNEFLVDGYVGYLILRENNVEETEVVIVNQNEERPRKSMYVYGTHWKSSNEYCWRITNRTEDIINLAVGHRAIVKTRYGRKTILISRIEERTDCPVITKVKRVYKCLPS